MNQRKLRALARDMLEAMYCTCNDDGNPKLCECGGDGIQDSLEGCWKCQAHTALYGYGKVPRVTTQCPSDDGGALRVPHVDIVSEGPPLRSLAEILRDPPVLEMHSCSPNCSHTPPKVRR